MQRRLELPDDLNNALRVTFVMLVGAELLGFTGAGLRLHEKVLIEIALGTAIHDYGSLALHFVLLFLCHVRPSNPGAFCGRAGRITF